MRTVYAAILSAMLLAAPALAGDEHQVTGENCAQHAADCGDLLPGCQDEAFARCMAHKHPFCPPKCQFKGDAE